MDLRPGAAVGPYRVVDRLGRGGMASVYRAHDPALDRHVALKILPREFLHDPAFSDRFRSEAQVIARLEHPGIVPIYAFDIDRAEGIPWMAMRLVPGGSLADRLRRERPDPARAVAILRGVADALDYAHGKGVVHRDVKPHNVLLDEADRVYLADFGIAKMLEASSGLTATGTILGTPQYMAPEQATGTRIDRRADIYALGIVAYELLAGHVPFSAETPVGVLMKQVQEPLPLPPPSVVPAALLEPVRRAAAKQPHDRWSSAGDFVAALEAGLGSPGESAATSPTVVSSPTAPAGPVPAAPTRVVPVPPAPPRPASRPPVGGPLAVAAPAPSARSPAVRSTPPVVTPSARRIPRGGLPAAIAVAAVAVVVVASGRAVIRGLRGGGSQGPAVAAAPGPDARPTSTVAPSPVTSARPSPAAESAAPVPSGSSSAARPTPTASARSSAGDRPPPAGGSTRPRATDPAPQRVPPAAAPGARETPVASAGGRTNVDEAASPATTAARPGPPGETVHPSEAAAGPTVAALVEAFGSRDATARWRAAEAVGQRGRTAAPAVPGLVVLLRDPDALVRSEAAKALGLLESASVEAVPALAEALRDTQVSVRREVARALARVSPAVGRALPALVAALEDKDRFVRAAAARALGRMGPNAASAGPALRKASGDKELIVSREAKEALRLVGAE